MPPGIGGGKELLDGDVPPQVAVEGDGDSADAASSQFGARIAIAVGNLGRDAGDLGLLADFDAIHPVSNEGGVDGGHGPQTIDDGLVV